MSIKRFKQLVNALLTAWRGSHKSVIAGNWIAVDTTITRGYSNIAKLYTAPSDGVLAVQTPSPSTAVLLRYGDKMDMSAGANFGGWPVTSIPLRRGASCYGAIYGETGTATVYLRFYPYVGSA